ncbi:MAG: DUF721 domain-containing protein [Geminicoccaceae bacterium]|nr:DUF721 domain-containing protein [Geminicoccaceae bacterium]
MPPPEPSNAQMGTQTDMNTRRLRATSAIGRLVSDLLTPAARRRGFAEAAVLSEWERIVGPLLARRCQPVRLQFERGATTGAVLHLRASSGAALEIQHGVRQILERVNDYMGDESLVVGLRLLQVPLPRPARPAPAPRGTAARVDPLMEGRLEAGLDAVAEGGLKEALRGLGRAIAAPRPGGRS